MIFFSYNMIHWSDCNRTGDWRKSVRFGFHDARLRPPNKKPEDLYNNIVVAGFKDKPEAA